MTRSAPERTVQRSLLDWLRRVLPQGSIVAAVVNEQAGSSSDPMARARFGMARKASGVVSGWPDLVACIPGGRSFYVEVKAPGGVVSESQQDVHAKLRALDHTVIVADSIESCRGGLAIAGIALREAAGQAVAAPKVRSAKRTVRLTNDAVPF